MNDMLYPQAYVTGLNVKIKELQDALRDKDRVLQVALQRLGLPGDTSQRIAELGIK